MDEWLSSRTRNFACGPAWLRVPYRPLAFVSFWVVLSPKTRSFVNGELASYKARFFCLAIFCLFIFFLFTQDERESFVLISHLRVDY